MPLSSQPRSRRTPISFCVFVVVLMTCAGVRAAAPVPATVTIIDMDTKPATTPGPGTITSGIVALDCNYRSIFVELQDEQTLSGIVLKSDPSSHTGKTGIANLNADTLGVYVSHDNVRFVNVEFQYTAPDDQTVVLSGFSVKARYLKVHSTCGPRTRYEFVNRLNRMIPTFTRPTVMRKNTYYKLNDPLFRPLLSDVPGPDRVLYWSGNCDDELGRIRPWFRAHALKFGYRYVFEEQLEETAKHNLVYGGKTQPAFERHGIVTWRWIIGDPGEAYVPSVDGMPKVFGAQCWLMDPRWRKEYFKRAVARAKAKEQWALCPGDETWEVFAINAVPRDKRYAQVTAADGEIREKYGFGKYGMPESNDDPNPFARIAHRRWVSDTLTDLFRRTCEAVKKVNPDTVMLCPDFASGVPAADIEAWAPYFDIFVAQSGNADAPFFRQFAVGCDTKALVDLCGKPVWMTVQNALPADYGWTVTPEDVLERYSQVFRNGGVGLFLLASEWYERGLSHPKYAEPAKWRALLHVVDTITRMNRVRIPKADCAILYSSDSLLTLRWAQMNNDDDMTMYCAYTVLGPILRSWFHFVSDRQIERGIRNLNDYKVLYVPFAEYERAAVVEKIAAYVRNGGTVVCTDPQAFTWDISGERHAGIVQDLYGKKRGEKRPAGTRITVTDPKALALDVPLTFDVSSPGVPAYMTDRVAVLAEFEDGSPAIAQHPYGKGKFILFASDPFERPKNALLVKPDTALVKLFAGIQKSVGAVMGRDIWRFKLPSMPGPLQKEKGVCLTGNYVFDRNGPIREPNDLDTGGTYAYSRLPTGNPDAVESADPIPFASGHLTNRVAAYETRKTGESYSLADIPNIPLKWVVSWTDKTPVSVTFDLKKTYQLDRLRFVYSASMPALKVHGSNDARAWSALAVARADNPGVDVKDLTLALKGAYRYVRLDFARRDEGDKFEISEVEIWGTHK